MPRYNLTVDVTRTAADGTKSTRQVRAIAGDNLMFPIDADVEEGDVVEYDLPGGKRRSLRLLKVKPLQSPFGSGHLDHIEATYESATSQRPAVSPKPVSISDLHPTISDAAAGLYASGHLSSAVFEAFRAVETRVQALSGREESGKGLMSNVFGTDRPALDITKSSGRNASDEREGFKFLFMGAQMGLRNPRGHGEQVPDSPIEAMEYLALASLLMRRLDLAETRQA